MHLFEKVLVSIRDQGVVETIKKIVKFICIRCMNIINRLFLLRIRKREYTRKLENLSLGDRVILWEQNFGWSVPLFQRPQHIARCLAQRGCSVFYYTSQYTDPDVKDLKEVKPNLYLVNRENDVFINVLKEYLNRIEKVKYLQVYSTNLDISLSDLKEYETNGYQIFYEYIDDLAPEISGTKEIPQNIQDKFDYISANARIPMAVTADILKKEIVEKRGEENLVFATNGVDVTHFRKIDPAFQFSRRFRNILDKNNKIVGYYGAIAKWFDYELLKYAAKELPDVEFVLIGKVYDESYTTSMIQGIPNIHFIGSIPYNDLPQYAHKFDVCTIPFVVNSITNATSPLKLFEYMAMEKPILTTAMLESSKYHSVHIANTYSEYVEKIKDLVKYSPEKNPEYYKLLRQEAEENRWEAKADAIIAMLCEYEKRLENSCGIEGE